MLYGACVLYSWKTIPVDPVTPLIYLSKFDYWTGAQELCFLPVCSQGNLFWGVEAWTGWGGGEGKDGA